MNIKVTRKKNEVPKKEPYTSIQMNSKKIIHDFIAEYDQLLVDYENTSSSTLKRKIEEFEVHLKNPSRLASYFLSYTEANKPPVAVYTNESKLRQFITSEIERGELITAEGLIRTPEHIPLENVSASGNVITVFLPPSHAEELYAKLVEVFIDEPVKVKMPCNNMIIIIEIGKYAPQINSKLLQIAKNTIMDFAIPNSLAGDPVAETTKYYLNYH